MLHRRDRYLVGGRIQALPRQGRRSMHRPSWRRRMGRHQQRPEGSGRRPSHKLHRGPQRHPQQPPSPRAPRTSRPTEVTVKAEKEKKPKEGSAEAGYKVERTATTTVPWGQMKLQDTPYSIMVMPQELIENVQAPSVDMLYRMNPLVQAFTIGTRVGASRPERMSSSADSLKAIRAGGPKTACTGNCSPQAWRIKSVWKL